MGSDRRRPAATELAKRAQSSAIEPLEPRIFCDHALASATFIDAPRAADRVASASTAGSTPSAAENLGRLTETVAYRGTLTPAVHNEYFEFSVSKLSTVGLSLTSLDGNANLELLSSAPTHSSGGGKVIATSAHLGNSNESIGKQVPAGMYYARVYETSGTAGFTLTLNNSAARSGGGKSTGGLHIVFNYSYDTSGFFADHPQAEALLNQAAGAFSRFTNDLTAITPGNGNIWSESFPDPSASSRQITLNDPSIASDTVVIYVGASAKLQTEELGYGAPGGWSATGSENWVDTIESRGQAGALLPDPTGYGPWGGSICFSDVANWNLSTALPKSNQDDFLSVATHEIAHILGFGTAGSWFTDVSGNNFIGPHSEAANNGKPVPLAPGQAHWANNFTSTVNGVRQDAEMDPYLIVGTRRAFTTLDYAGLEDVGWTI